MPSPQPLRITNKEMIFLFVSPKFQQLGSKFAINSKANAPLKTDEDYVNANNINCNANAGIMCKHGQLKETLHILEILNQCHLDSSTYACLLQGCLNNKSLPGSKRIHAHIIQTGFHCQDVFLWTLLVTIYAKLGFLLDGRKVFDKMPQRNVVSWTVMIAAYSRHGFGREAMALFRHMQDTDVQPNQFTFASVIPACASLIDLEDVYDEIRSLGYDSDVFIVNGLVDMYAKCGSIEKARDLFDKMPMRSVVSWNAMIAAYAQKGYFKEALKLFKEMPERNVASWNAMIAGYAQNGLVEEAMNLFREMPMPNVVSWTSMITGYAQDGKMDEALKLFQEMPERNVVSWNAMIAGYAQNGLGQEALKFFCQMKSSGFKPNSQTFVGVLPVCANLAALEQGMEIHDDVMRSGYQSDIFVGNALVDMYAKCGSIENARHVFDKMHQRDVVTWNAMIGRYAQNGHGNEAVKLFKRMRMAGVKPDLNTFASVLPACAGPADLEQGMEIHEEILGSGLRMDIFVQSALVDMYAKCGRIDKAQELFHKMPQRNVVSWTTVIAGCAQNGQGIEALKLFQEMQASGTKPDLKTIVSVLPACASLAALEQGMEIHTEIIRCGFEVDVFVGTTLIDMYAKCGSIDKARNLFDKMPQRNFVSWTAIIAGYAMHGFAKETMQLFEQMQHVGMNPDHVTLVCVLSACCHAGLVDQGCQYFDSMSKRYQITPTIEHYGCMVDLFGRAGCLEEALDFINKMPIKPDATVWSCLLGACRIHNNVELGELAAKHLFELEPTKSSHYVLLSNIYAAAGRWDGIEKLRTVMKDRRIVKTPGCSWIVVNKQVHGFLV